MGRHDQAQAHQKVMKTVEATRRATARVAADKLDGTITRVADKVELCYAHQAGGHGEGLISRSNVERLEYLLGESFGIAHQALGHSPPPRQGAPGGGPPRGSVQARLGGAVEHRERSRDRDSGGRQERGGGAQRSGRGTSQVRKKEAVHTPGKS